MHFRKKPIYNVNICFEIDFPADTFAIESLPIADLFCY